MRPTNLGRGRARFRLFDRRQPRQCGRIDTIRGLENGACTARVCAREEAGRGGGGGGGGGRLQTSK